MKSNLFLKFIIVFVCMIILRLLISPAMKDILLMGKSMLLAITALYAIGSAYMIAVTFKVLVGYFSNPDS